MRRADWLLCKRSKSWRVNLGWPRFAKKSSVPSCTCSLHCMECGGEKTETFLIALNHAGRHSLSSAQSAREGTTPRFLNGRCCRHSCQWWRCQLNLTPGIHIEHEPANKYRRRNLIGPPQEIRAGDIWRNLATMQGAEESVCETGKSVGVCQLPGYTLSLAHQRPIVNIAAIGILRPYFRILLVLKLVFSSFSICCCHHHQTLVQSKINRDPCDVRHSLL